MQCQSPSLAHVVCISPLLGKWGDCRPAPVGCTRHRTTAPRGPGGSAFLGGFRKELRRQVLNGLAVALGAVQVSGVMLGNMLDMLENLAALRATVSVRRHCGSPR